VLVQDPYERKMVAVIRSRVQGGGEGLVARRHLTQGTVIGRGHPAQQYVWTGGLGSETCEGKGHLAVGSVGFLLWAGAIQPQGQESYSCKGKGHKAVWVGVIYAI
jgi:hypothetical protein